MSCCHARHQDSQSWQEIFPRDLVSAWTAIDHATTENGCLQFVPGSHRWGLIGDTRGADGTEHPLSQDWGTERWPAVPVSADALPTPLAATTPFRIGSAECSAAWIERCAACVCFRSSYGPGPCPSITA
jgi:hypothetical protein